MFEIENNGTIIGNYSFEKKDTSYVSINNSVEKKIRGVLVNYEVKMYKNMSNFFKTTILVLDEYINNEACIINDCICEISGQDNKVMVQYIKNAINDYFKVACLQNNMFHGTVIVNQVEYSNVGTSRQIIEYSLDYILGNI